MAGELQVSQIRAQVEYAPSPNLRVSQVEAQTEYQPLPNLRASQVRAQVEYGPSRVMVSQVNAQFEYGGPASFVIKTPTDVSWSSGLLTNLVVVSDEIRLSRTDSTEERHSCSLSQSGSSYTYTEPRLYIKSTFILGSVYHYVGAARTITMTIRNDSGTILRTVVATSSGAAWVRFDLESMIEFTSGVYYRIRFTYSSAIQLWRHTSNSYNGTLFQIVKNYISGGGEYTESVGLGLIPSVYSASGLYETGPYDMTDAGVLIRSVLRWMHESADASASITVEDALSGLRTVSGESVGTGTGSQTVFTLDYYPASKFNDLVIKLDGTPTTAYTRSHKTITFSSPPGSSVAITADYTGVDDPTTWYTATTSNNPIEALGTRGFDLSNKYLWIHVHFNTTDTKYSVVMSSLKISINPVIHMYYGSLEIVGAYLGTTEITDIL